MLRDFSIQAAFAGALAAFVGAASTFAVVLNGLQAVGATPEQATTGLMATFLFVGVAGIGMAIATRVPIGVAWSVPGAALLGSSAVPLGGFASAVGALVVCGLLIVLSGLVRPFGRMVEKIPRHLASALISGVLIQLCFAPFVGLGKDPLVVSAIIVAWGAVGIFAPKWAVPAAVLVFLVLLLSVVDRQPLPNDLSIFAKIDMVKPRFEWSVILGLGVPLFIVTMAGQNIPGVAVMRANNYEVSAGRWFTLTGLFSTLGSLWASVPINLAAVTAALMAGQDCHPDPKRRYWAAIVAGAVYLLFGVFTGVIVVVAGLAPLYLIQAVAGLALIPVFMNTASAAFALEEGRLSGAVTFLFGASGMTLFGISGAFWGLIFGVALYLAQRRWQKA